MKVKVLKKFKDRYTGEIYKVGEVFRTSRKRFAEIQEVNESLVEEVTEDTEGTEEE